MPAPTISVGFRFGLPNVGDFIVGLSLVGGPDVVASGFNDVTAKAERVQTRRGRWTQLTDVFEAGSLDVTLLNLDRAFDPTHISSPYYGRLNPGRDALVTAQASGFPARPIMQGTIDDWDLAYDTSLRSSATASATDVLGMLGGAEFDAWTNSAVGAGEKLRLICERPEIGIGGTARSLSGGVETLQSDSVSWGSNALNYAQKIARSELGYLYADRSNVLTFRDRNFPGTKSSSATFGGAGIPFEGISAQVGSETLYARVGVDREGGVKQTATTAVGLSSWQSSYGTPRSLTVSGTLLATDAQALSLAQFLVRLYDSPKFQISEIRVGLHALTAAQQDTVLGLDITDVVTVAFRPNDVGSTITQQLVVQGIAHDIDAKAATHVVTFSLITVPLTPFRVGSSLVGGSDLIAF